MGHRLRRRFWFEAAASGASVVLLGVTLFWPNWIEVVFQVDPDRGSGLLERLVLIMLLTVLLSASVSGRREWRRSLTLSAAAPAVPGRELSG